MTMTDALTTVAAAAVAGGVAIGVGADSVRNIVLVNGAFADGSGWRGVYDALTARGHGVSIAQNPLTSLADDVAATRRVLNRQDGPAILVGHSYGGSVITEAGTDPKVAGLVYMAGFAPEVGQSTLDQYAEILPPPTFVPEEQPDGLACLNADRFHAGLAGDAKAADAAFPRDAQVPIAMAALAVPVTVAAWKSKPSWYVAATEDGVIAPELLRSTAGRIGAETTEVPGSHVVFLTQPKAVADAFDAAARGAAKSLARKSPWGAFRSPAPARQARSPRHRDVDRPAGPRHDAGRHDPSPAGPWEATRANTEAVQYPGSVLKREGTQGTMRTLRCVVGDAGT